MIQMKFKLLFINIFQTAQKAEPKNPHPTLASYCRGTPTKSRSHQIYTSFEQPPLRCWHPRSDKKYSRPTIRYYHILLQYNLEFHLLSTRRYNVGHHCKGNKPYLRK